MPKKGKINPEEILRLRFQNMMTFSQIAKELNCSTSYAHKVISEYVYEDKFKHEGYLKNLLKMVENALVYMTPMMDTDSDDEMAVYRALSHASFILKTHGEG